MHTVRSGDTLYSISMEHQVPLALLLRANPYVDVYNLQVGETICVPVRANDQPVMPPYGGTCSKWEVRDATPMPETANKMTEEMEAENRHADASGGQSGENGREENRMEEDRTKENRMDENRRGDSHMNETRMDTSEPMSEINEEMPVHGMEHTEQKTDASVYIVRDGDTLESILGVDHIVLQPGTALYRQK